MAYRDSTAYTFPPLIYFIQAGECGPIKIGRTDRPAEERLSCLQTATYLPLRLIGTLDERTGFQESYLHRRFEHLRIRGEWFALGQDLIEFILAYATPAGTDEVQCVNLCDIPIRKGNGKRGRPRDIDIIENYIDGGAVMEAAWPWMLMTEDDSMEARRKRTRRRVEPYNIRRTARYLEQQWEADRRALFASYCVDTANLASHGAWFFGSAMSLFQDFSYSLHTQEISGLDPVGMLPSDRQAS